MELLKYIKDIKNDEESFEMITQYINDYPMGEPLKGMGMILQHL